MVAGGNALTMAAEKLIVKGKKLAAHMLEAAEADIIFADNAFSVAGTDKKVTLKQVAMASFQPARLLKGMEPGFIEHATYAASVKATYPNGRHVCVPRSRSIPKPSEVDLTHLSRGRRCQHGDQSDDARFRVRCMAVSRKAFARC